MRPRSAIVAVVLVVSIALVLLFPSAQAFAEAAARELRFFWWLILLFALGIWLVWGVGRRRR